MADKQLQAKLNQLARLANEIVAEAQRRWPDGQLFYEAEGTFCVMSGDATEDKSAGCCSVEARQAYVQFKSQVTCRMEAGAW